MRFTKGHGTGNDFVILPDPDGRLELTPGLVAALCDRRRGIGADGVLRVVRSARHPDAAGLEMRAGVPVAASGSPSASAEWFMDYWNADGSLAEMCGNGVRVFTRYLVEMGLAGPQAGGLLVATRAGMVWARVGEDEISVDMGRPQIGVSSTVTVGDRSLPGVAVDCGNPHLVCFLPPAVELSTLDLARQPGYDTALFPSGVNIEFVTPAEPAAGVDLRVRLRVYERGSAETLSCGSGACAVAAVTLRDAGRDVGAVAVEVPGGRLTVTVEDGGCWLAGPAVLVAHGEVDPTALG